MLLLLIVILFQNLWVGVAETNHNEESLTYSRFPKSADHLYFSFNKVIYVSSEEGTDIPECGSERGASACSSIAYAYLQTHDPAEIVVDTGRYVEDSAMTVSGSLSLTGLSKHDCFLLSKTGRSSALFLFESNTTNTSLTLIHLTVLLTNDRFLMDPSTSGVCKTTLMFEGCLITMELLIEHTYIYGGPIFIENNHTTLSFNDCILYNITTSNSSRPIVFITTIHTVCCTNASFLNIHNAYNRSEYPTRGVFDIQAIFNLTFADCFFAACRSTRGGGVVGVQSLYGSGSVIRSCVFTNNTAAGGGGGALQVSDAFVEETEELFEIDVVNTVCVYCQSSSGGGAFAFINVSSSVTNCSFANCVSNIQGGALSIRSSTVEIHTTVFVNCFAVRSGGAVEIDGSIVNVGDSLFVNNTVEWEEGAYDILVTSFDELSVLQINNSYSISSAVASSSSYHSINCRDGSECDFLLTGANYRDAECGATFGAGEQLAGVCALPCAAYGSACVKPNECSFNSIAVGGVCVPRCVYWKAEVVGGGGGGGGGSRGGGKEGKERKSRAERQCG